MGRIKQGLDSFPLSTDFMHDRIVRRVMKREGDSAFTVLIYIMSYLYSGEGYYVRADTEEEGSEGEKVAEGAGGGMREECDQRSATRKRNLTQEDIDRMQVPPDGCPRNFSGLLENLRLFRVPPAEQYTIVLKSNYGEIGGDIWKGFSVIRGSGGKIKLPGHYLLSVLNK